MLQQHGLSSCGCMYDYVKIDLQLFDKLMFQISFRRVYMKQGLLSANVAFLKSLVENAFLLCCEQQEEEACYAPVVRSQQTVVVLLHRWYTANW